MPPDDSTFVKFDIATKELADARVRFTEADYTKKASELREEVVNVKRELVRCKEDIIKITPSLLEQFLSHQYVIKHKIDFGFVTHDQYYNPGEFNSLELISKKYVHLHINNKMIIDELNYLEEIIK
jgi:replicative superfamily II helicase